MFQSYLKVAFRNFVLQKYVSLFNLVGLTLGIAKAMFIIAIIAGYYYEKIFGYL